MPLRIAVLLAACALGSSAFAQSIFTIAGGGTDDGRPATIAALQDPQGIAVDRAGNFYVADRATHRIRRINLATGIITTIAGTGSPALLGDGGFATAASLAAPSALAFDAAGNLHIADTDNHRVRKIDMQTGIITMIAGGGENFPGDGGPATLGSISYPEALAFDPSGNLYIAESNQVRKVDARTGILSTVAGSRLEGFSGDGGAATAAKLRRPLGLAFDPSGNLYIADSGNERIRRVAASDGIIKTIAGDGYPGFSGDGGPATAASLNFPRSVAFDASRDLYIAVQGRIRKIATSTGRISTIAGGGLTRGDGGPATAARLKAPRNLVFADAGHLYVADPGDTRVRRIAFPSAIIETVAGNDVGSFFGDGGIATAALLSLPPSVTVDPAGNLYIADSSNHRVRRVAATTRVITTVAGGGTERGDGGLATAAEISFPDAVALDARGDLYISSDSRVRKVAMTSGRISTVAGGGAELADEIPATAARLRAPRGMAFDAVGNLYIAEYFGNRIRKVSASNGIISSIAGNGNTGFSGDGGPATAASLYFPTGVALSKMGDIYIVDFQNDRIRKVAASTGIITTVAGDGDSRTDGIPATAFDLAAPQGAAVDSGGNLYIANTFDDRVHRVDAVTGILTTIAGGGSAPGDGGPSTGSALSRPAGVSVDDAANIYIADTSANRIRVIYACTNVDGASLTSPGDAATGLSTSPKLLWTAVRGAFQYDVLLDTVSPPKEIAASDISTFTFAPTNLQPLTTYYWQVVAKGDPFCVPFSTSASEVRSFTTAASCDAPGPIP